MKYNPEIHKRRSIRLKGYNYSQAGLYFITICCERRGNPSRMPFGHIDNNEMILNENGIIAYNEWGKLAERFQNFELDVFQIMPNHMHGIIVLNDTIGATLADAPNDGVAPNDDANIWAGASPAPTISDIVGAYKSLVSNGCLEIYKSKYVMAGFTPDQIPMFGKLWQRNYYEHIIRDERAYQNISNYIINNPAKWQEDKFHENTVGATLAVAQNNEMDKGQPQGIAPTIAPTIVPTKNPIINPNQNIL